MFKEAKELYKEYFSKEAFIEDCAEKGIIATIILDTMCIFFLIHLFILILPILPFIIINELSKKYFKNKINNNDNKCKNKYTNCNTCNKCEYKEDCKNGF